MSKSVHVIIPYFQRQAGILRRALASVRAQQGVDDVHVIIIDDQSPVPPGEEIAASGLPADAVRVVQQANTGPGPARSNGLDHVPEDAGFVAFLDSDDQWLPGHLRNALDALGEDLDVYFANYLEPEATRDQFQNHGRIVLAQHQKRAAGSNCYRFGHSMIDQIIMGNVIETSTVVYRWAPLRSLRFDPNLRNAFEDHAFWVKAQELGRGFAFSTDVEVQYGRGVSIWRSTFHAGSERVLPKLIDQRRYLVDMLRRHARLPEHRQKIRAQLTSTRRAAVEHIAHYLRRGMKLNRDAIKAYLRSDPAFVALFLPILLKIFVARAAKRETAAGS
jgi:succinoglycan biosynthesis protein ExoW